MGVRYNKENLQEAVEHSSNWSDVCRHFGLNPLGGSQGHLKERCLYFGINFNHFCGSRWSKGKSLPKRMSIDELLSNPKSISSRIRNRLIDEGIKTAQCEVCGLVTWQGEPITLELDHKDSNHFNNKLENLQILCANCHGVKTRKSRIQRRKPRLVYSVPLVKRTKRKKNCVERICSKCGGPVSKKSKQQICWTCWGIVERKVIRPSIDVLLKEIQETSYVAVGKKYGVSDNAIRKWIKISNRSPKPLSLRDGESDDGEAAPLRA
jgi:5-methylcytosine-specific restriction endonuclease McrA